MSIMEDQQEIVRVGTINAWAFKVAIWFAPIYAVFLTTKVLTHDTEIAVLKIQMAMRDNTRGSGVSQNVNVGQSDKALAKSGRDYLTVAEVATAEGVAERTITDWISKGRIMPLPEKHGKEYTISADYRILPQDAACCGDEEALTSTSTQPVKHEPN
jgi:hypothetical protein